MNTSTSSVPTLTRSRERLAVGSLALSAFVIAVNVNIVGAVIPFLEEDPLYSGLSGDESAARIGQLLWVTSLAASVACLLLGPVVDRVGRRGPMLLGSIVFVLAMSGHYFAADHGQLLVLRALSGIGGGLVFTSASAAVADLVPYERRGAAMGLFSMGLFLAIPLGLPMGLWLASGGEGCWRTAFAWLVVPGILSIVGFMRFLPSAVGRSEGRVSQLQVLKQKHVFAALLSVMLYTGAFFTAVQFAPKWLNASGLVPKSEQPFIWIVLGLSTAVGSLWLPRLADRVGKRNVVLLTSAGVAVCLILFSRVDSLLGLWLVGIPMTLLAAARTPSLQALMSEIVEPRMRGTLMGLRAAAVNLGAFAFTRIGSGLYKESGYDALLYASAFGIVLAYLLIRWFVRVRL